MLKMKYKIRTGIISQNETKKYIRANGLLVNKEELKLPGKQSLLQSFPPGSKLEPLLIENISDNLDEIETDLLPDVFSWSKNAPNSFSLLVVSPKLKEIISSLNSRHSTFLDTKLLLLRGEVNDFKILHITELPFLDYIDFEKTIVQNGATVSLFFPSKVEKKPQIMGTYENLLEIAEAENWATFETLEFHPKPAFWEDDFMFAANHGFIVSQKFIDLIEQEKITGLEYDELKLNFKAVPLHSNF